MLMSDLTSNGPRCSDGAPENAPVGAIDASLRWPLLALAGGALGWLLVGSALALLAFWKLQHPAFFSVCEWVTYGRVYPAATNVLLYGFALPMAYAFAFVVFCRAGGNPLRQPLLVAFIAKFWHAGVALGLVGLLAGDSTGYLWLELPKYAAAVVAVASLLLSWRALSAFSQRRQRELQPPQWFMLALVFWFPWIFLVAQMMLVHQPVRGVVQAAVNSWYAGNLFSVVLPAAGLGVLHYFIPALLQRPLASRSLAIFSFWTLLIFGAWSGFGVSLPLPRWMLVLSGTADFLLVLPVLAVVVNLQRTLAGRCEAPKTTSALRLLKFGLLAWVLAFLLGIIGSQMLVSEVTEFSFFVLARPFILMIGFAGLTAVGGLYYLVPQVTGQEFPSCPYLSGIFSFAFVAGVVLLGLSLAAGGFYQGAAYHDHRVVFMQVVKTFQPWLMGAMAGTALITLGVLALLGNLVLLAKAVVSRYCPCCCVGADRTCLAAKEGAR
jgi:cytochrome c oxidase cbb3-type subunit 1